ncbi:hypothetical protein FACS189487_01170 [Campylobacterota bacterium]|nr:hypothetical protein FACS189487_01170 [Campylobacterota bacterium]
MDIIIGYGLFISVFVAYIYLELDRFVERNKSTNETNFFKFAALIVRSVKRIFTPIIAIIELFKKNDKQGKKQETSGEKEEKKSKENRSWSFWANDKQSEKREPSKNKERKKEFGNSRLDRDFVLFIESVVAAVNKRGISVLLDLDTFDATLDVAEYFDNVKYLQYWDTLRKTIESGATQRIKDADYFEACKAEEKDAFYSVTARSIAEEVIDLIADIMSGANPLKAAYAREQTRHDQEKQESANTEKELRAPSENAEDDIIDTIGRAIAGVFKGLFAGAILGVVLGVIIGAIAGAIGDIGASKGASFGGIIGALGLAVIGLILGAIAGAYKRPLWNALLGFLCVVLLCAFGGAIIGVFIGALVENAGAFAAGGLILGAVIGAFICLIGVFISPIVAIAESRKNEQSKKQETIAYEEIKRKKTKEKEEGSDWLWTVIVIVVCGVLGRALVMAWR